MSTNDRPISEALRFHNKEAGRDTVMSWRDTHNRALRLSSFSTSESSPVFFSSASLPSPAEKFKSLPHTSHHQSDTLDSKAIDTLQSVDYTVPNCWPSVNQSSPLEATIAIQFPHGSQRSPAYCPVLAQRTYLRDSAEWKDARIPVTAG